MKIALDALGGDYGVKPNVLGAIKATEDFGCHVILVGDETKIKEELKQNSYVFFYLNVYHVHKHHSNLLHNENKYILSHKPFSDFFVVYYIFYNVDNSL